MVAWNKGMKDWRNKINKPYHVSNTTKQKISSKLVGRKIPKEQIERMRKNVSGSKNHNYGRERDFRCKEKISKTKKIGFSLGLYKTRKGYKHSEETKRKISMMIEQWIKIKGHPKGMLGKKHTDEWKKWLSEKLKGSNSHFWKGGLSFIKYPQEFDKFLKYKIKERDNYTCQLCKEIIKDKRRIKINPTKKWLTIHHIDYNKHNCKFDNLIVLCNNCNCVVNFSREEWTKFFKEKLKCKIQE